MDDLLAALLRASAPEALFLLVALLSCLGAPISWKKAYVGDDLIWCGWRFNFAYETVELCAAKEPSWFSKYKTYSASLKRPAKT